MGKPHRQLNLDERIEISRLHEVGTASADEQFSTITGVEAQAMTNQEMEVVRGSGQVLFTVVITPSPFNAGKAVVSD